MFGPPIEGFSSGDYHEDAIKINQVVQDEVRNHPEQYLWLHRRFKMRPAGEISFYE